MAVSNTRTPARPAVLAAYMAMSASRSSRSGSSSPPRASRTPTLARARTSRPDTVTGVRRTAASRSPRVTASASSATWGRSTANSSPPSPGGGVGGLQAAPQPLGHHPQDLVAGGVAEAVVDGLEVVQVEQEQGRGGAGGNRRPTIAPLGRTDVPGRAVGL